MKLLKKIAPFAISALMLGATLGGAAAVNIADWKDHFDADNTAIVLGTGTPQENDLAAAMVIAKQVGIDTTAVTVSGEKYKFEKSSDLFNLGDAPTDIRTTLGEDQMSTTLADGLYKDENNEEYDYTQEVTMATGLDFLHFVDTDYNNKAPTLGIQIARDTPVLTYIAEFTDNPPVADMDSTTLELMGKEYYVISASTTAMDLLDASTSGEVIEGTPANIGGKTVEIVYVTDTPKVKLKVGGETTTALAIGATYKLADGTYVGIKDAFYNGKDTGKSSAEVTVGTGKITISADGSEVEVNGDAVDQLYSHLNTDGTNLLELGVNWSVDDESFVTSEQSITLPVFGSLQFMTTGMVFPTGETIEYGVDGDNQALITVPIKDGNAEIPLLYDSDADGDFDSVGGEDENLVVTTGSYLFMSDDMDDKYFVVSGHSSDEAESYYLEAKFVENDDSDPALTIYNVVAKENTNCEEMIATDECELGDYITLEVESVNETTVNISVTGTGVSFDELYTAKGGLLYLPQDEDDAGEGFWNGSTGYGGDTWGLKLVEADDEGTLYGGEDFTITYGFTDDDLVKVSAIATSQSDSMLKVDSDHYIGYVTSALASKIERDETDDQIVATATYYGEEVYAEVYLTGAGASSGKTSWVPVQDSETSKYVSQNIVVIGGTAVNAVARRMLDLGTEPVYGNEAGWLTNTNVDATGKGILWLKSSPYTEGTGKYALLVAGYLGPDTEKSANFLQLKGDTVAKDKIVIDTNALVEAS